MSGDRTREDQRPTLSGQGTRRPKPPRRAPKSVPGRQALPAPVRNEALPDLLLRPPRMRRAGPQPALQLQEVQVARRQLVVAALAVQREHLQGPRPDPRDRAQTPPGTLVV